MTALSLAEITDACPRLARRLQRARGRVPAEILPLIRSALVARGYAAVADSAELAAIPADAWRAHGFRPLAGEWQAEPWRPQWLERGDRTRPRPARLAPRRPNWQLARTASTPTPRGGRAT